MATLFGLGDVFPKWSGKRGSVERVGTSVSAGELSGKSRQIIGRTQKDVWETKSGEDFYIYLYQCSHTGV